MADGNTNLITVLPPTLEASLRGANPWWRGETPFGIPPMHRWPFGPLRKGIDSGLTPVQVLRGPRQVGKTTLLNQLIRRLLADGVRPDHILRVQFDDLPDLRRLATPILEIARWFAEQVLHTSFHAAAHGGQPAILLLDEVQNLADWDPQLKNLVDLHPVRVLVTGSSALRIEAGRDSLAGRITTIEVGPLLLREIGILRKFGEPDPFLPVNGSASLREKRTWQELREYGREQHEFRDAAFEAFSERGAYPVAQARADEPWESIGPFLTETVIQRAIRHDLRMGPRGKKRDENLLEEVFRIACRYVGQSPSQATYLNELRGALNANVGWQRVLQYLQFLDGTLLLRLIPPLELRLKKRKGAPKLCLSDHMLRAAWLQEVIPLSPARLELLPHLSDLAGRIAESAAGYFLKTLRGVELAHFPERPSEPEVDFILTIGEQRIPAEIKYRRRIDFRDTAGLRSFMEKTVYHAPFGLLVTLSDDVVVDDPRIVALPLSSLLLLH